MFRKTYTPTYIYVCKIISDFTFDVRHILILRLPLSLCSMWLMRWGKRNSCKHGACNSAKQNYMTVLRWMKYLVCSKNKNLKSIACDLWLRGDNNLYGKYFHPARIIRKCFWTGLNLDFGKKKIIKIQMFLLEIRIVK